MKEQLNQLVVIVIVVSFLIAGCSSSAASIPPTQPPAEMRKGPRVEWHLVVISESSGWGLGQAFAEQIEKDMGVKVVLDDFAIGNLSAGEVLQVLQTGKGTTSRLEELAVALKRADVVVMFGNPMLSVDAATGESINSCFGSTAPAPCTPKAFEKYTTDLEAIWAKVFELRSGQPTVLRAIDVASPFVNNWIKYQTFDVCTVCWECVSNAVRQAAEAYRIPFLSRYDTFNGVKHDQDPKQQGYIGRDGIHPNDQAQQRTADLLAKLGYEPVPLPAAQSKSPEEVLKAVTEAVNRKDVDTATALLADDVTQTLIPCRLAYDVPQTLLPAPICTESFHGKETMRERFFKEVVALNAYHKFGKCDTSGDKVTCAVTYSDDSTKPLGFDLEFTVDAIVQNGLLKTVTWKMTDASLAKMQAAMANAQPQAITLTFAKDKCTFGGPMRVPAGEITVNIKAEGDASYGLFIATFDKGKTLDDLNGLPVVPQPEWVHEVDKVEFSTNRTIVTTVGQGPIYLICFNLTGTWTQIGRFGPIEVGK